MEVVRALRTGLRRAGMVPLRHLAAGVLPFGHGHHQGPVEQDIHGRPRPLRQLHQQSERGQRDIAVPLQAADARGGAAPARRRGLPHGEGPAHRRALQPLAGERLLHQRDARATYLLRRDAAQRQYRDAVRLRGASRREGVLRRAAQRHAESRRRAHPCDRHRPLGQVVDGPRDTRHQEPAERRGRAVPGQHGHPPGGGRVLHSRALAEGRLAQARRGRAQHAGQRV